MKNLQIIYDNECHLCNQAVRFLKNGDESGFRFYPATAEETRRVLDDHKIPASLTDKTVILLDENNIYTKSTAIIRAIQNKGGGWKIAGLLFIVPRFIRDAIYDLFARNRKDATLRN